MSKEIREAWQEFLSDHGIRVDFGTNMTLAYLLELHATDLSRKLLDAADAEDPGAEVQVGLRLASYLVFHDGE